MSQTEITTAERDGPLLQLTGIRKGFPGVQALDGVSLTLAAGEVLALVGENGAGKSTLMKILAGVYQPDEGTIFWEGQPVQLRGVNDAMARGISLIHQELNLAENLSVTANLFLGREKTWGPGLLDRGAMRDAAQKLLERVGLEGFWAGRLVSQLAPGQKQLVEIARALSLSARVIIMDEPTSSLTQKETDRLYEVIDDLRASGIAVVYISHRLAEVKRLSDRVVVLRDGKNAGELARSEVNHDALVRLMVGRELKPFAARGQVSGGGVPLLELQGVTFAGGSVVPIDLLIYPGEIYGMAGLVGAGRTELAEAIFGIRELKTGTIRLDGRPIPVRRPHDAIAAGIVLVPEDRRHHGLVLEQSVGTNLSLPNFDRLRSGPFVSPSAEKSLWKELIARLGVKTPSARQKVGLLSGGNQQKVVLGKWLAREPRLLILDEPTRGVDVGARSEIYRLMEQLAAGGAAIWMISSDLEEVLGMSDRVAVLHEGKLAGELTRAELSEEAVMRLATGTEGVAA